MWATTPSASIEIEQRHKSPCFRRIFARLQQQTAVVEREADDLLDAGHDVLVADPAHILRSWFELKLVSKKQKPARLTLQKVNKKRAPTEGSRGTSMQHGSPRGAGGILPM